MIPSYIRVKAIFLVERNKDEIFVSEVYDSVMQKNYYRPIGGTVEFGEKTIDTLKREILEETGETIRNISLFHVCENIFTYDGHRGHEIVFIYKGGFERELLYSKDEFRMIESNGQEIKCFWLNKQLFKEGKLHLVPESLLDKI